MHLNSNDIFSQIGLVVSNQESSTDNLNFYTVYLEIELSQGRNELLEIRNYDDPHEVALAFCRKHKLNELAVQIVENKIIEAKQKEERKIKDSVMEKSRESNSFMKSSVESKYKESNKLKESLNRNPYLSKEGEKKSMRSSLNSHSRSNNKSFNNSKHHTQKIEKSSPEVKKSRSNLNRKKPENVKFQKMPQEKSPSKAITKQNRQKSPKREKAKKQVRQQSPKQDKTKKGNPNIGNQLYARAMVRSKMQQNERQRRKQQQLKEQSKELTFQPKINSVSSKIVQFRKEYGEQPEKQKQKENKKQVLNQQKVNSQIDEIRECTFKPQINRVSDLISQNRNAYKDQFDHFTALYKQAETRKEKFSTKLEANQEKKLFQPKINTRSSEAITDTFEQRLEKSIIRKKQLKDGIISDQECSFKPKVGRAPKNSRKISSIDSNSSGWWNQLHSQKLRTSQIPVSITQQTLAPAINPNSNVFFENLVEKRTLQVFRVLDSDEDGLISPDSIAIERLTKNQLIFLRPLFEQMDEIEAYLDFTQFRKALHLLLNESDVHRRGQFLTQKPKRQERSSFTPEINRKSKQLAMTRIASGVQVFDQLYSKGLKEMQRKQYQNQKIREQQQELEMQQCSFKPLLNNTSKYYIDKVLGKKISKFDLSQCEN